MERWGKLIAIIGGLTTLGGGIVTGLVSLAHSAAATEIRPVAGDVNVLKAVVPSMDRKLDILIELSAQREWRERRIAIPTTITPSDAGVSP